MCTIKVELNNFDQETVNSFFTILHYFSSNPIFILYYHSRICSNTTFIFMNLKYYGYEHNNRRYEKGIILNSNNNAIVYKGRDCQKNKK